MLLRRVRLDRSDDAPAVRSLLDRSAGLAPEVERRVAEIIDAVRSRGDAALRELTEELDGRSPRDGSYEIPREVWQRAADGVDARVRTALAEAARRIRAFHERQIEADYALDEHGTAWSCALIRWRAEIRISKLETNSNTSSDRNNNTADEESICNRPTSVVANTGSPPNESGLIQLEPEKPPSVRALRGITF